MADLSSLKVGDRVAVVGFDSIKIATIAKITATGRVRLKGMEEVCFSEKGDRMGSSYPRLRIRPIEPRDEIHALAGEASDLLAWFPRSYDLCRLDEPTLRKLCEALTEAEQALRARN